MKTFTERFFKILQEADEETVSDAEAAAGELDAGTDPAMLDVEPGARGSSSRCRPKRWWW